jgi:hypothetical protein
LRNGTYQSPNKPITTPTTQVHTHQCTSPGSALPIESKMIRASSQPAVKAAVT